MEKNLKLVCPKCGTPYQPHSPHTMDADGFERCEIRTIMEDRGWCYECSFWQNMYDKHKDDPGWVRIDGESWVLKPMVEDGTALDVVEERCISISKGRVLLHQITAGAKVMFRTHSRI